MGVLVLARLKTGGLVRHPEHLAKLLLVVMGTQLAPKPATHRHPLIAPGLQAPLTVRTAPILVRMHPETFTTVGMVSRTLLMRLVTMPTVTIPMVVETIASFQSVVTVSSMILTAVAVVLLAVPFAMMVTRLMAMAALQVVKSKVVGIVILTPVTPPVVIQ